MRGYRWLCLFSAACLVSQQLAELFLASLANRFAKTNSGVLDCVMVIDRQITRAVEAQAKAAMFGNLLDKDWIVTTVPNDVNVYIVSSGRDLSFLVNQLQDKAQRMLDVGSRSSDPILLRRICDKVMESFGRAVS